MSRFHSSPFCSSNNYDMNVKLAAAAVQCDSVFDVRSADVDAPRHVQMRVCDFSGFGGSGGGSSAF